MIDLGFLERINGIMIYLPCATLCHAQMARQTQIYKKPLDFKYEVVGGKVSEHLCVLSTTKIVNRSRKRKTFVQC